MIASFGDRATEDLYNEVRTARMLRFGPSLVLAAQKRLDALDRASDLGELREPPGNRPEALRGDLSGMWSIRVNRQWRIVFRWLEGDAYDVRLVDYH